jgi:hypothetical protein
MSTAMMSAPSSEPDRVGPTLASGSAGDEGHLVRKLRSQILLLLEYCCGSSINGVNGR